MNPRCSKERYLVLNCPLNWGSQDTFWVGGQDMRQSIRRLIY